MTRKGGHHTEETKQKLSASLKGKPTGRKASVAFIEGMKRVADSRRGIPLSDAHKLKVSLSLKGKRPKNLDSLHVASVGKPKSDEARRKMSEAKKKLFEDPEIRKRQNHMSGKTQSEESRLKISQSNLGRVVLPETREKIRVSLTGRVRPHLSQIRMGRNNPSWKGGISFAPYCEKFTKEFKERVRAFFSYQCAECGTPQSIWGKVLAVHHVDFNKDSCCSEETHPLFVPLCNSCHSKTNTNRSYWREHFTEMINSYYGGKCYLSKEELSDMSMIAIPVGGD